MSHLHCLYVTVLARNLLKMVGIDQFSIDHHVIMLVTTWNCRSTSRIEKTPNVTIKLVSFVPTYSKQFFILSTNENSCVLFDKPVSKEQVRTVQGPQVVPRSDWIEVCSSPNKDV